MERIFHERVEMRRDHVVYLCCPACAGKLSLTAEESARDRIVTGELVCMKCSTSYPIVRSIPRLLPDQSNYANDFGFQWNKHYRTQYDSYSGVPVSEERFFKETGWPRAMAGQVMLEAGCGSGRFTEHAASTGAMVISFDYSNAVEANYRSNGSRENVLIVQADIFRPAFHKKGFDKIFCIGVIQHTPSPSAAFASLASLLKPGGNLVVDAYEKLPGLKCYFETKYWVRPLTKRLSHETLYRFCEFWVKLLWPLLKLSYRITGRRTLSWFLLVADYRGVYPLSEKLLQEWSILDSFDMLAPEYDYPQTIGSVTKWYVESGLVNIDIKKGYNGIQGSGWRE